MATTIDIAKRARAGGACFAEVSLAELEQVEGGCWPLFIVAAMFGPPALGLALAWALG
jgi:lactobin A/cerein 7B family class IIb bacteriocin